MRFNNIILLSSIICIVGVLFFFACKNAYESKQGDLNKKAITTFAEAIDREFKNRKLSGDISLNFDLKKVKSDTSSVIYWIDESGRYEYRLNKEKSSMNVTGDSNDRFLHTIAFRKHPLQPDSLNANWRELLASSGVFFKSALHLSIKNIDGSVKSQDTYQSEWRNPSDSVLTRYIGYACEIEAIGYLHYSMWGLISKELSVYFFICVLFICVFYKSIILLRCKIHSLRTKEIVEVINEVPVEVIKEVPVEVIKEVPVEVRKIGATPIHSYKLSEDIIFYADRNILMVCGVEKKMQAQSGLLLELFLNEISNDYILKDCIIIEKLWPDGSGNDSRMHKAVGRLRLFIHEIDPSLTILRKSGTYQLIIPEISSTESDW